MAPKNEDTMSVGDKITVVLLTRHGEARLFRATVTARAWPGSRFHWFEFAIDRRMAIEEQLSKRFMVSKAKEMSDQHRHRRDLRERGHTWVDGHDSPEAHAFATALALGGEEETK